MSNTNQPDHAKSVIINGLGYLNRVRKVVPQNGYPYLACDVALMQGTKDNIDHARFNCIIRGQQAINIVEKHFTNPKGVVESPKATVMANMTLGGITAQTFVYESGEKQGQTGIALRSTLLSFKWLKVGKNVVPLETGEQAATGVDQPAAASGGEPAFVAEMRAELKQNGCVRLSKDHPEFEERRAFLRENGLTFNRKKMAWVIRKQPAAAAPEEQPSAPAKPPVQQWTAEDLAAFESDIPF